MRQTTQTRGNVIVLKQPVNLCSGPDNTNFLFLLVPCKRH